MRHRFAVLDDAVLLGELNHQLIQDEGHRNPMTPSELADRMRGWLGGEYRAVVWEDEAEAIAYALYREEVDHVYLRQLFVERKRRSAGIGRAFVTLLLAEIWPRGKRITVEVLCHNDRAIAFYRSLGFGDYSLALERPAQ
jgi:ribosomal protein S18 acetylase RimI-like enzyme